MRETTIHGEVFVVGDDDLYVSSFESKSTKDLCDETEGGVARYLLTSVRGKR